MNSPRLQKPDEFETTIAQDLRAWGSRVQAPENGRAALLRAASGRKSRESRRLVPRNLIPTRLQRWLTATRSRPPKLPQTELTQWLFTQAMWHNLGIDRRAVRFVC